MGTQVGIFWDLKNHIFLGGQAIMALTPANICSSLRTMPIIDYDVVKMNPNDMIGCDNRGAKGVRLGQLVLGETVSH